MKVFVQRIKNLNTLRCIESKTQKSKDAFAVFINLRIHAKMYLLQSVKMKRIQFKSQELFFEYAMLPAQR